MNNFRNIPPHLTLLCDGSGDAPFFSRLELLLEDGLTAVLVRDKTVNSGKLLAFCAQMRQITRHYSARLLIHTDATIARAVQADGVHLPFASGTELPLIRGWLNDRSVSLSLSCHSAAELDFAHLVGADFAFLSPVFATASHPGAPFLGAARFHELANAARLPVVALGGINAQNVKEIGQHPRAVIRALLEADDPKATLAALRVPIE